VAFQWDERKNEANIRKHGVPFGVAEHFDWDTAIYEQDSDHEGEDRQLAYGYASDGVGYVIVIAIRGEEYRVISARRLTRQERRKYPDPSLR
jgi:uncharacterized DUF497 family protein